MRAFERVIEQEPQDAEGYLYLGDALIRANNFEGALRPLEKALELKPDSSLGHYMYAYSILKGESPNNSLATHHLEEALRLAACGRSRFLVGNEVPVGGHCEIIR